MDSLMITDNDGDTIEAHSRGQYLRVKATQPDDGRHRKDDAVVVDLTREAARSLVDYLTAWLEPACCPGDDPDCCPELAGWERELQACVQPSILEEAQAAIYGDREDDYGTPRDNWTRTAILWTGLLQHKLADGEFITPEDGLRCMVAVKLARDVHSPKRDNRVDGAGYFAVLDRLETGK